MAKVDHVFILSRPDPNVFSIVSENALLSTWFLLYVDERALAIFVKMWYSHDYKLIKALKEF